MAKAAVLGYGTVGSGVARVLTENLNRIESAAGMMIDLGYILDVREFPGDRFEHLIVKDFDEILNDGDVTVVCETIGGTGAAYEFTKKALKAGKCVVTSNKELVAKHGIELMALAAENKVSYLFEASVGGGIPIIRPLAECLAANEIEEICGIVNGTTNYILTRMMKDGAGFDDALKEAQDCGYAERDPSADIEGLDAGRKICILAAMAYGVQVGFDNVKTEGITKVTPEDIELAGQLGYRIKLIARTCKNVKGAVAAYAAPHLVNESVLLSSVDGVMNAIMVRGSAVGDVMFYGAGAGSMATASAVVADVIKAAKSPAGAGYIQWKAAESADVAEPDELVSPWFIHVAKDKLPEAENLIGNSMSKIVMGSTGAGCFVQAMSGTQARSIGSKLGALSVFRVID